MQPTIESAFAEWKSARSLLACTIQSYLSACANLHAACAKSVYRQTSRQPVVEEILVSVNSELESLALEEDMLRDGRSLLSATRNNSINLVRMNTLPSEILVRIFALLKTHCVLERESHSDAFANVCVYWRQIAMATSDLWTHVDIGPVTSDSRIKLLLDRSKDSPLHVHAIIPRETHGHVVQVLMKPLGPHLHRLRALSIESNGSDEELVSALFNQWLSYGCTSTPASLSVKQPLSARPLSIRSQGETSEKFERLLLTVSTLHLDNVKFDWASNAYRGLVDFQLDFAEHVHISPHLFFGILSACPALHTLKLRRVIMDDATDWRRPAPIAMGCLEVLGLECMDPSSANSVLSLITLSRPRTELSVGLDPSSAIDNRFVDFLARSKLAALHCHRYPGRSIYSWKYLFHHLPRPHALVLENFYLTDQLQSDVSVNIPEFLPPLKNVIFLKCKVDLESLKELVVSLETQELRLELCSGFGMCRSIKSIRTSLLEMCPELQCSISDIDSTKQLACRTMFND